MSFDYDQAILHLGLKDTVKLLKRAYTGDYKRFIYEKYIKPELKYFIFSDCIIDRLIAKYGTIKTKELLLKTLPMFNDKDRMDEVSWKIKYPFSYLLLPSWCGIKFDKLKDDETADLFNVKGCWYEQKEFVELIADKLDINVFYSNKEDEFIQFMKAAYPDVEALQML